MTDTRSTPLHTAVAPRSESDRTIPHIMSPVLVTGVVRATFAFLWAIGLTVAESHGQPDPLYCQPRILQRS